MKDIAMILRIYKRCLRKLAPVAIVFAHFEVAAAWTSADRPSMMRSSSGASSSILLSNWSRRQALGTVSLLLPVLTMESRVSLASPSEPMTKGIRTVILDSPNVKLGIKLEDKVLGKDQKRYPVVQSITPDSPAAEQGVVPGMVVLGSQSSGTLVQRLQRGPYPFAVQFYDMSVEMGEEGTMVDAVMALDRAEEEAAQSLEAPKEPQLSSKGAGLGVKKIRKVRDCPLQARRGDTVKIIYEARVASPGGPIYDSTADRGGEPVTFRLGEGKAISGVEIGMGGMCQGEIRELNIPSTLGYGRFGTEVFDIPGDVRLWWRVELLELMEGEHKFPSR